MKCLLHLPQKVTASGANAAASEEETHSIGTFFIKAPVSERLVSEEEHERTIKKALYFYPKGLFAHRSPLIAKIRKETEEFSSIGSFP